MFKKVTSIHILEGYHVLVHGKGGVKFLKCHEHFCTRVGRRQGEDGGLKMSVAFTYLYNTTCRKSRKKMKNSTYSAHNYILVARLWLGQLGRAFALGC